MIALARILCPVDFSEFSTRALARAAALADVSGARLTVQYVTVPQQGIDLPPVRLADAERAEAESRLRQLTAGVPDAVPVDVRVDEAFDVHRAILQAADALPADLLVIGSHGRSGFERLWLGSVTEKVLRKATCPVLVVPCHDTGDVGEPVRFRQIVCAVDFSDASNRALQHAAHLAGEWRADLTVLHVIEVPPELLAHARPTGIDVERVRADAHADALRHLHEHVRDEVRTEAPVHTVVRDGTVYREVLSTAVDRHADLIVMGVHGRGAIDRLVFGSNTARVVRAAACPVLVVRPA